MNGVTIPTNGILIHRYITGVIRGTLWLQLRLEKPHQKSDAKPLFTGVSGQDSGCSASDVVLFCVKS